MGTFLMKSLAFVLLLAPLAAWSAEAPYSGSNFNSVSSRVEQGPYQSLPLYKIVSAKTLKAVASAAMNATLDNRNDFRERRVKLVHQNGICLSGEWQIDTPNKFSGYFAPHSRGLVVARASVTQDLVNYEDHRAFGLAVKLFPTLDPNENVYTSNLFSVDNIEGSKKLYFVQSTMTNQIPDFDFLNVKALVRLASRLKFLVTFNNMSKEADTGPDDRNPLIRRSVEVARAGISREFSAVNLQTVLPSYTVLHKAQKIIEPKWVAFEPVTPDLSNLRSDFRNEIQDVLEQNRELNYRIVVATEEDSKGRRNWERIGTIRFDRSVISEACDLELHFHHPRTDF